MSSVVEFHVADGIGCDVEIVLKFFAADDYGSSAVVGVKTECVSFLEVLVEKENNMVLGIVDEAEWRYTSRLQTEVAHHALGAGETELAGTVESGGHQFSLEPLFEVVNIQVVIAIKTDKIVLISLVVAQEDVLAVQRTVISPPLFSLFDGFSLRMTIAGILDTMLHQPYEHLVAAQDTIIAKSEFVAWFHTTGTTLVLVVGTFFESGCSDRALGTVKTAICGADLICHREFFCKDTDFF